MAEIPSLIRLPSELLHHILVLVSPSDLATLCQTSQSLNAHISASDHLWKQTYLNQFDLPRLSIVDPLLTQPCPSSKRPLSTRKLEKQNAERPSDSNATSSSDEKMLFLELASFDHSSVFNYKIQIQRRTWAENQLRNLQDRPFDLVSNYNDTMRTLLSIVRSRQSRGDGKDPETSASCQYLISLLTSNNGYETFKRLIYPRTDISRLKDWQRKTLFEKHGKVGQQEASKKIDSDKRNRSTSNSSALREVKRRKTAPSRSRRRSARLLLHTYPAELHHLLFDKDGNDLIDLDNGQGLRSLEELELLDEQLAAELHVLHGIRPSKTNSKQMAMSSTGVEAFEHSEDEEGDQVEEEEVAQGGEENDEEEEEEEDLHHHYHHHHYHHHHHLPLEQPLGSENGYEGDTILRGRAREIVYDTANYGPENSYGPLRAWRERWNVIDGSRPEDRLRQREEEEEEEGNGLEENDEETSSTASIPSQDASEIDMASPVGEANGEQMYEVLQDVGWNAEWEPDPDFEVDMEDEDEEGEDEDMFMMEVRELDIARSHGLHPYHESRRLKHAMMEHNVKTGRQKSWSISSAMRDTDDTQPPQALHTVWRMEKRIDWVVLEAVMVVMSCNLRHAIANHGWGRAFRLPGSSRSLTGQDAEARRLYASQAPDIFPSAWRNLLCLPCGWNHSRGDERTLKKEPEASRPDTNKEKPVDWASVESTWIGTYAFLDWSKWAAYNARDPVSRGMSDSSQSSDPCKPMPLRESGTMSSLKHEREAVGDCLQLRMELLPLSEQKVTSQRDEALQELEGPTSSKYPPLRFRGSTVTYLEDGPPTLRGQVHGVVSPIYAPQDEDYYRDTDGSKEVERAILGLHWQLNHAYDGEDRWSLSGIQPGPPGSRAPIYGIWGASDRTDNLSPCGPFTYMKVSDMPWKKVDELLQEKR